jgi:ribonuclease P protein component
LTQPSCGIKIPGSLSPIPGPSYEAFVSAAEQAAHQQARFPRADGDPLGSRDAFPPAQEGTEAIDRPHSVEARGFLTRSERFARASRLARASEIRQVLATGRRKRLEHLDLLWTDNTAGHPRLGLIVPKFQSSAVARNRLRRRLKEVWRRELQRTLPAMDLLIRTRREAYRATFAELKAELTTWVQMIGRDSGSAGQRVRE